MKQNEIKSTETKPVPHDAEWERLNIVADVIEVFEDFLDEKGIVIPNEDKDIAIAEGGSPRRYRKYLRHGLWLHILWHGRLIYKDGNMESTGHTRTR